MLDYMEQLSVTEVEALKQAILVLFRQTCVIQIKYNAATLVPKDNPLYGVIQYHYNFIRDYLEVIGCELNYDIQEKLYWISGEGVTHERLSETATLLILLLKLIYRDKIMGAGLKATQTTWREIREYGKNTNLISHKLTRGDWREAFGVLKTHQVVEIPCAVNNIEDETPIYIYGTINIYCRTSQISSLIEMYREEADILLEKKKDN